MQLEALFDVLIDKRRQEYLAEIRQLFSSYMMRPKSETTNLFLSFTKWPKRQNAKEGIFSLEDHKALFDSKNSDLQDGGIFLSLNQKGIVINPGSSFFEEFCNKGYSLQDIDVVFALTPTPEIEQAIRQLQSLNRECSRTMISYGQAPHVIRFLLHPELFGALSSTFRPISREELGSVQSLETFTNTEEVRPISETLSVAYTPTASGSIAIRLTSSEGSIGYIASGGYHEALASFFEPCAILVAGIGACLSQDLEELSFQHDALGFYGLKQIVANSPNLKLVLVTEFARSMGDVRLELTQKCGYGAKFLPLDVDFRLDIDTLVVETASTGYTDYKDVKVVRPEGSFGKLLYVDTGDVL